MLSLSFSFLECVLVQSGLVHDLLHPQHHLFCQISQVLQENEDLWCLWVSSTNKLQRCVCWICLHTHVYVCTCCARSTRLLHLTVLVCLLISLYFQQPHNHEPHPTGPDEIHLRGQHMCDTAFKDCRHNCGMAWQNKNTILHRCGKLSLWWGKKKNEDSGY